MPVNINLTWNFSQHDKLELLLIVIHIPHQLMTLTFKCDLGLEMALGQYGFCTLPCGGEHLSQV